MRRQALFALAGLLAGGMMLSGCGTNTQERTASGALAGGAAGALIGGDLLGTAAGAALGAGAGYGYDRYEKDRKHKDRPD